MVANVAVNDGTGIGFRERISTPSASRFLPGAGSFEREPDFVVRAGSAGIGKRTSEIFIGVPFLSESQDLRATASIRKTSAFGQVLNFSGARSGVK